MTVKQIKEFNTEKPSVAIRQALEDVEAVEASDNASIDMARFYSEVDPVGDAQREQPKCVVCFAGAVMLQRFKGDSPPRLPGTCVPAGHDPGPIKNALYALDAIRNYRYSDLLECFYIEAEYEALLKSLHEANLLQVSYAESREAFKKNMNTIADICERHGH